jgi:hypothetical protein
MYAKLGLAGDELRIIAIRTLASRDRYTSIIVLNVSKDAH